MVRTAPDLPGEWKHLRFEPGKGISGNSEEITRQHAEVLTTFPGVKGIVLHLRGQKGEHPHLHVWWVSDISGGITSDAVRKRLKSFNDVFKQYHGQRMWSARNHDNYEAWATYVTNNGSHEVIKGDEELLSLSLQSKQFIATPTTITSSDKVVRKRPNAEERLIAFCEAEYEWEKGNVFHIEHPRTYWVEKSKEAVIEYSNGRVHNNQLLAMTRNVMYVFGDKQVKDRLKVEIGHTINFLS